MSRIGKRVLKVADGIEININNNHIVVKGKLGTLEYSYSPLIKVTYENGEIKTNRSNEEETTKQLHGTTNAIC